MLNIKYVNHVSQNVLLIFFSENNHLLDQIKIVTILKY